MISITFFPPVIDCCFLRSIAHQSRSGPNRKMPALNSTGLRRSPRTTRQLAAPAAGCESCAACPCRRANTLSLKSSGSRSSLHKPDLLDDIPERISRSLDKGEWRNIVIDDSDSDRESRGPPSRRGSSMDRGYRDRDSVLLSFRRRTWVLFVLLLLQSVSGFVLQGFRDHILRPEAYAFISLFLTMLVGAGGNAGNQSAVFVIRSLATGAAGSIRPWKLLTREAAIGLLEACALSVVGLVRVLMFEREMGVAGGIAVAWALFFIVLSSVLLGTMLPLALWRLGIDPAHAGPGIQVLMDILGVALSCTAMAMLT